MPGCSPARIQMAPVPPISAKGLSPMISAGPRKLEADGVVGEGADGVELVCDAQDDARGVGSVGNQRDVIGQQREFLIDALAGEAARDDLLALDESIDAQITPAGRKACSDRR